MIDDLRGELGVKFHQIEGIIQGNKDEMEESISDLSAAMTDAFKENNSSLRTETRAIKADTAQEFQNTINDIKNNLETLRTT